MEAKRCLEILNPSFNMQGYWSNFGNCNGRLVKMSLWHVNRLLSLINCVKTLSFTMRGNVRNLNSDIIVNFPVLLALPPQGHRMCDAALQKPLHNWLYGQMRTWIPHPAAILFAWCIAVPVLCRCGVQIKWSTSFPAESESLLPSLLNLLFYCLTQIFHSCPSSSPPSPTVFTWCHFVLRSPFSSNNSYSLLFLSPLTLRVTWTSPLSSLCL